MNIVSWINLSILVEFEKHCMNVVPWTSIHFVWVSYVAWM